MLFYTLPNTPTQLYPFLHVFFHPDTPKEYISNSLARLLYSIKENIRTREKEWDVYKKYTNNYEYIHTIIPHKKKAVSKYKPLSRSYFKMVEMVHEFQLLEIFAERSSAELRSSLTTSYGLRKSAKFPVFEIFGRDGVSYGNRIPAESVGRSKFTKGTFGKRDEVSYENKPICTFHLAEGPGGFIEAVANMRQNPMDMYYGMTILDEDNDYGIPAWKKSDYFLATNPNVFIEKGADGTGNILSVANFDHCRIKYSSSMDFITADGGFDFSTDFNKQELSISRLLFAQIAYALIMQKVGGNFVLKIFDCFYENTADLLFLLTSFYKTVYITKPQTSRTGNSEKYIVCKGFLYSSCHSFESFIRATFVDMANHPSEFIHRFLAIHIPSTFVTKLEEYNAVFGQKQIENIHNTLSLIEKPTKPERIDALISHNITKCIQWCARYNVPYYHTANSNVFL